MSKARWASKCPACKNGISPGDEIRKRYGAACHLSCADFKPDDQRQLELVPRRRKLMDLLKPTPASGV